MNAPFPIKYVLLAGIGILVAGLGWKGLVNKKVTSAKDISYNYQIRPILSDKCFACHGPDANKREAGLRLDMADNAYAPLEDKKKFAIVPGNPAASEVYKRITSTDPGYQMPTPESHLGLLNEGEIDLIKNWIAQGARYEQHWAFAAPKQAKLPEVSDKDWCENEIDRFTLAKMEEVGLAPNDPATREQLLKRLAIDLTGLAPSLEIQRKFAEDNSANAYEKIVDNLMSQKAYGEKMAIHWLDIARFADSYGYQNDDVRTQWAWRDWVIHAFNSNMPYDRFLVWQLAGDLLPNPNKEQILATAFLRNHKITEEDGVIPEEYRVEYHLDKTKTFSSGLLGLTVECAQCHDHKYDPVSQEDYYRLFAFFNSSKEKGFDGSAGSGPAKTPVLTISSSDTKNLLNFINSKDTARIVVSVMGEDDQPRPAHVLNRGVYDAPGKVVTASALPAVMKFDTTKYPRNRLGLAKWTTSKQNPLTARVFVNQIWQEIFGRGLVKSTGDFGMQGELPSHPELLDWLAVDFMNHGWNIKRLIRQIVTSATYRQSSGMTEEKKNKDPENIYLARGARYRVPAESIRDIILSTSGLLNPEIGGPSVKPYQPKGIWEATTANRGSLAKYIQDTDSALYRRGLYTFIKLTLPPPAMIIFDASNRDHCEVKRQKTNTPLQALVMLNDPTVLEASRVLAEQLSASPASVDAKISEVFQRIVCRKPNAGETQLLVDYYKEELSTFSKSKSKAGAALNIGDSKHGQKVDVAKAAAMMRVISTIYNMEETITKS
ncbi:PSD1 and planctomycete cytochrome C domain-containing protein [Dyadobacter sp. CY261]|uniref:PSD1 and planctomycete cytochrome C domain-containing protein n=1 Tax=Dyadobacter sp. CY261 TaxID=2907203 RepID=UPI001F3C4D03|nr:PSD1 and planctomycete cytochrome C domain-containing protein [Dyadobacter sp. CY261]MCF0074152.1 PSD1 and planctomycete cytochrome C domain-containing protein [Dyadobacter sp. CY261]